MRQYNWGNIFILFIASTTIINNDFEILELLTAIILSNAVNSTVGHKISLLLGLTLSEVLHNLVNDGSLH